MLFISAFIFYFYLWVIAETYFYCICKVFLISVAYAIGACNSNVVKPHMLKFRKQGKKMEEEEEINSNPCAL